MKVLPNKEIENMSAAEDLIERMERETGQRIDANGGDNMAMNGLLGAMARLMGKTPPSYKESDDVAVGTLLRYQMSPEYAQKQRRDELLREMLLGGLSPDDISGIFGAGEK